MCPKRQRAMSDQVAQDVCTTSTRRSTPQGTSPSGESPGGPWYRPPPLVATRPTTKTTVYYSRRLGHRSNNLDLDVERRLASATVDGSSQKPRTHPKRRLKRVPPIGHFLQANAAGCDAAVSTTTYGGRAGFVAH